MCGFKVLFQERKQWKKSIIDLQQKTVWGHFVDLTAKS